MTFKVPFNLLHVFSHYITLDIVLLDQPLVNPSLVETFLQIKDKLCDDALFLHFTKAATQPPHLALGSLALR